MMALRRPNTLPGCAKPENCLSLNRTALCDACQMERLAPSRHGNVLRIELTPAGRRKLGDMAREAKVPVDELASRLLSDLLDEDAAAHGATA